MTNKITQSEMDRRRKIIAQVDANNRLEDITPPTKNSFEWILREKWVLGEITTKERITALKKQLVK